MSAENANHGVTHPLGACPSCGEPQKVVPCLNCSALAEGDSR